MSETTKKPTTRRALMGNAGIAALAGIAAVSIAKPDAQAAEVLLAPDDADTSLMALCGRFLALQAMLDRSYDEERQEYHLAKQEGCSNEHLLAMEGANDVAREPWSDEQWALLQEIREVSATTLAGQRARARVLMAWSNVHRGGSGTDIVEWKDLAPLFSDLLGEPV